MLNLRSLVFVVLGCLSLVAHTAPNDAQAASAPEATPEATPITIVTYNIRYGTANDGDNAWPHRREQCLSTLRALDADVIGLQEALAFQIDEILADMPGYVAIGAGRDDGRIGGEHASILVRTSRFSIDHSSTMWLSDDVSTPGSKSWGNEIPRICTFARLIDRPVGKAVWIYNTHLDHRSQPSRDRGMDLIARTALGRGPLLAQEPIVVMGDFNAGESNSAIAAIKNPEGVGLVDSFRVRHPDATEVGTFNAFKDQRAGEKIDHIFISPAITTLDAGIDRTRGPQGQCPSDHDPVWASIVLP
jgi:endonuclease/exonuclease/phosphatase family metal-dependent hydrolase